MHKLSSSHKKIQLLSTKTPVPSEDYFAPLIIGEEVNSDGIIKFYTIDPICIAGHGKVSKARPRKMIPSPTPPSGDVILFVALSEAIKVEHRICMH